MYQSKTSIIMMIGAAFAALVFYKKNNILNTEEIIYKTLLANRIPAPLALCIVAQSKHETAMLGVPYMSHQFLSNNNCFGYGFVPGNRWQLGNGGQHQEKDGFYAKYASVENSVNDIAGWYSRRSTQFFRITNIDDFAEQLKKTGYYTDTVNNYMAGLNNFYKPSIA